MTACLNTEEGPVQLVRDAFDFQLARIDLSELPREAQELEAETLHGLWWCTESLRCCCRAMPIAMTSLKEKGIALDIKDIFQHLTIERLAMQAWGGRLEIEYAELSSDIVLRLSHSGTTG